MPSRVPRLSLGMPVYNGENFIGRALDTLLAQTFQDFEIVICDNASSDRTEEICRGYAERDGRIRYYRNESNIGAAPNFNRVFELSTAPYFRWAPHDDAYEPTCLERCVEVLDDNPDVVLCYTDVAVVDEDDARFWIDEATGSYRNAAGVRFFDDRPGLCESVEPDVRFRDVLKDVSACQQLLGVVRRDALMKTGLFRSYYGTDKVILAELALLGRFFQIEEPLFLKRVHPGISFKMTQKQKNAWIGANVRKFPPQLYMLRDYFGAVGRTKLTLEQRVRAYLAIFVLFKRHGLWRRIFVPGPDNYLGLEFGFGQKQSRRSARP